MTFFDRDYQDTYTLIELTDYCNLKCPMCSHVLQDGPHSSAQGFMDRDLYFSILDRLKPRGTHHALKLFWLGESFMHPEFYDILKGTWNHLNRQGFKHEYIDLHTNGHFLSERNIELLLQIGDRLPRLTLSLDALTQDVHSRIRRRGNVEKVNQSIRHFLKRRVDLGKSVPSVILQFIVLPENAKDAAPFVKYWTEFIDSVHQSHNPVHRFVSKVSNYDKRWFKDVIWLKRVDCAPRLRRMAEEVYRDTIVSGELYPRKTENWEIVASIDNLWENQRLHEGVQQVEPVFDSNFDSETFFPSVSGNSAPSGASLGAPREMIEDQSAFNKEEEEPPEEIKLDRPPCAGPFKTPCIRWDGEVAVCCFDPAMQMGLGNIKDTPFDELWYGERANQIRLAHIEGRFADIVTDDGYQKCLKCSGYDTPVLSDEEVLTFLRWVGKEEYYPEYLSRVGHHNG